MNNITELAKLLASVANIEVSEDSDAEDIIRNAIKKLSKDSETKDIAKEVKADVKDQLDESVLNEMIADLYVSNMCPPFWDRVTMKYLGYPDIKSWAELDNINLYALHGDGGDPMDEDADIIYKDDEDQVTNDDLDSFISQLGADEYMKTCYDDDEYYWDDEPEFYDDGTPWTQYAMFGNYTDDELRAKDVAYDQLFKDVEDQDLLSEALTLQQRLKKAIKMRAKSHMIAMKRRIALRKHASPEKLQQRARKLAIRMMKQKFAGGKNYNDLGYSERSRIENILAKKTAMINNLARRMLPIVRKIEKDRFSPAPVSEFNKQ